MKKLFTVLTLLLVNSVLFALTPPVPQKMSYQAVVRNSSNVLVTNQQVGMKTSILQGSVTGTAVYVEIYNPNYMTNANGLVTVEIGGGIPLTGTFSTINWATGPYFIKIETDPTGGTNYTITAVSELLSVPYALHAKTVETGDNWGIQKVVTDATLSGNGLTSNPLIIPDGAITSLKIANGSVGLNDLATNSVDASKIVDLSISTADLANNSVTNAKIVDGTIISADLADNAVTVAKISSSGAATNQVLTYSGSDVVWGYGSGAAIKVTLMSPGCYTASSFTSTAYTKIADIGSFTKTVADSRIEITFNGRIWAQIMTGTGAHFELRVDNISTTNGKARATLKSAQEGNTGEWVSIDGIFTGLTIGTHTISMWIIGAGGSGTNGGIDPGCFSDSHLIAREIR